MIEDLIYSETIKVHARFPVSERAMTNATSQAKQDNALCGDSIEVFLSVSDGMIDDISFVGRGCQIMRASASMMCQQLTESRVSTAESWISDFKKLIITHDYGNLSPLSALFHAFVEYPSRRECVLLPWQALEDALASERRKAA